MEHTLGIRKCVFARTRTLLTLQLTDQPNFYKGAGRLGVLLPVGLSAPRPWDPAAAASLGRGMTGRWRGLWEAGRTARELAPEKQVTQGLCRFQTPDPSTWPCPFPHQQPPHSSQLYSLGPELALTQSQVPRYSQGLGKSQHNFSLSTQSGVLPCKQDRCLGQCLLLASTRET